MAWPKGVPHSSEHRSKIAAALVGRPRAPFTAEHLAHLSSAHIGNTSNHVPLGSLNESHGYVRVKVAEPNTWEKVHRLVYTKAFGPIPDDHVVHHKNGDKQDNRLENLELLPLGEHSRLHHVKV